MSDITVIKVAPNKYRARYTDNTDYGYDGYIVHRYTGIDGVVVTKFHPSANNGTGYSGLIYEDKPSPLNPLAKEGMLVEAALDMVIKNFEEEELCEPVYSFY